MEPTTKVLFKYLHDIIYTPEHAFLDMESLPPSFRELGEDLEYLAQCIVEAKKLARSLSMGEPDGPLPSPGNETAASLKSLHASLTYLSRQSQQIAKGDYKQRAQVMEGFSESFNTLAQSLEERGRIIARKDSLLHAVNNAAALLLQAEVGKFEDVLLRCLGMMVHAVKADRAYIWKNHIKDGKLYCTQLYEWSEGVEPQQGGAYTVDIPYSENAPGWEEKLSKGQCINAIVRNLSSEEQATLSPQGILSILVVPVFIQDEFWGFVGFDDCHDERLFSSDEESALRFGSLLFANAMLRHEITKKMYVAVARMEAVIKNYTGIIWCVDKNHDVKLFDGLYLKELGLTPDFVEGKNLDVARQKNWHMDIIENVEKTFYAGPQNWISEIDGKIYRAHTTPIYDEDNDVTGVVGSIDDITGIIRLQSDLEMALERAQAASRAKSLFLAKMSHEIRTPMNAVLGITAIQLQNHGLSQDMQDALGRIYTAGRILLGIIDDILDLSKIEAGKMELAPVKYEIASLINDAVQLNMMRIGDKPLEFKLQLDENMPAILYGDELRIKQILNNLLSNAFKYTPAGEVILAVSAECGSEEEKSDVTLVLRVSDTGQGMTPEQVDGLFKEYARFETISDCAIEGVGLGLHIARQLAQMMNGEIAVESEPGKGSTFTVRLPQGATGSGVLGRELAEALRQQRIHYATQIQNDQFVREPMPYGRVLIVDDLMTNLYVAKGFMAPYGLSIDTATSGFEAIDKIRAGNEYDIVFMDHMMPKMDGIETTKILRDLGWDRPIVALTANAVVGQAEMFLASGFDAFISKPVDLRQLNAVLNRLIRDKQPPEVLETARRHKAEQQKFAVGNTSRLSADPELAGIFVQEAARAVAALEAICKKRDTYGDEDIQAYVLNVHAMKSALVHVGEKKLSEFAGKLEEVGRKRDTAVMWVETPAFLDAIRALIKTVTPKEDEDVEIADEDTMYLREKLLAVQAACDAYDKKTAKDALAELRQRVWSPSTREQLDTIAAHLLHSDFEEAAGLAEKTIRAIS